MNAYDLPGLATCSSGFYKANIKLKAAMLLSRSTIFIYIANIKWTASENYLKFRELKSLRLKVFNTILTQGNCDWAAITLSSSEIFNYKDKIKFRAAKTISRSGVSMI